MCIVGVKRILAACALHVRTYSYSRFLTLRRAGTVVVCCVVYVYHQDIAITIIAISISSISISISISMLIRTSLILSLSIYDDLSLLSIISISNLELVACGVVLWSVVCRCGWPSSRCSHAFIFYIFANPKPAPEPPTATGHRDKAQSHQSQPSG